MNANGGLESRSGARAYDFSRRFDAASESIPSIIEGLNLETDMRVVVATTRALSLITAS